ncbi:hypothetical protein [Streptomyces californicus]|uniref:hypothetical protein n=1 Tax=Streptomyces californicus TaxID=67351 RepID=UPI00296F7E97|nr:hypothetical protein [Streptomyces californicus]MDW4912480.1 hypothetical protein [Streptomyces californicus]
MSKAPAAQSGPLSLTITTSRQPGTIWVGPFNDEWAARGFAHALQRIHRADEGDLTIGFVPYQDDHPHLPLPAGSAEELARQIRQEGEGTVYPDLFTRLVAHLGHEEAARAWLAARTVAARAKKLFATDGQPADMDDDTRTEPVRDADSVPTHITALTYTAPGPVLSQNGAAEVLAHYWPAIEKHLREQISAEILASGGHIVDGDTAWDSGRDREHAARIAAGP